MKCISDPFPGLAASTHWSWTRTLPHENRVAGRKLVLAASPVEKNQESTKRGWILFFASAPIKSGFSPRLFGGEMSSSSWYLSTRRSELASVLTSLRSWQERRWDKPLFLLNNDWAVPCVRHSRSFRAQ